MASALSAALLLFPAASAISVVRDSGHAAPFDAGAWLQPRVPSASGDDGEPHFAYTASEVPSGVAGAGEAPSPRIQDTSADDSEWEQPWMDGLLSSLQQGVLNATFAGDKPKAAEPCFKFMHIPKTGGTSIDSAGMHQQQRPFGSLMANTYDRIASYEGKSSEWEWAGNTYDKTHQNLRDYIPFVLAHFTQYRWSSLGLMKVCQDLHTPPHKDSRVGAYFKDSCGTFCAVRDPLDRYLSGYKMHGIGPCNMPDFEAAATTHLKSIFNNRYQIDCHFTPQVEFVYGAPSKAQSSYQYCQRVIHTERLNEEFKALMLEQGRPDVEMGSHRFFDHSSCDIHSSQVPVEVVKLVYALYKEDYEALGYDMPAILKASGWSPGEVAWSPV